MAKVEVDLNQCVYPMPVTLVGANVKGKPNFLAIAWVNRANYKPPMIVAALSTAHYTTQGIHKTGTFSVNIPSKSMVAVTDYCGLFSGDKTDKSEIFEVFYGSLGNAPMIKQCPLSMECKLVQWVELQGNTLFIGEIVGAYADDDCLTDGKPDVNKINPFTLTMPDGNYWLVGPHLAKAWDVGKGMGKL